MFAKCFCFFWQQPISNTLGGDGDPLDILVISRQPIAQTALVKVKDNSVSSYRIVSEIEADIQRRQISISSPMGRALINKKLGDFMILQYFQYNLIKQISPFCTSITANTEDANAVTNDVKRPIISVSLP